eukprot:180186_1
MGFPPWDQDERLFYLHHPGRNGLTYLTHYSMGEAQEMLTSNTWTRAVFLREPKERLLSAFLDKFVKHPGFFQQVCCSQAALGSDFEAQRKCIDQTYSTNFSYFLRRTLDCPNSHWNTQASTIDQKWWKMIDFVGYMDNASVDAAKLLRSVTSSNGTTAWDDYGSTGWGEDGTSAFMARRSTPHTTGSHDKTAMYYSKCDEAFVEKYWAADWEHDMYHFKSIHLFDDKDLSDCTEMLLPNEQIEEATIISDEVDNHLSQQGAVALGENHGHDSMLNATTKMQQIIEEMNKKHFDDDYYDDDDKYNVP